MDLKNSKLMLLTAVFSAFSYMAQAQYLSAKDIYKYAKSRNYNALSRISGYIDTQDGSGNTALCLAVIDDDYQTYNLLRQYGANPQPYCLQSAMAASGSSTFLGMGTTGWLVTGAIVAAGAGIAVAAGGGGGGGGSSDSSSSNDSTTPITCVNGSISNGQCQCNDGWTGDTCNTAQTCSYNTTSCTSGYEETGNTCKSGNITYKECKAKTVPDGYTKNPCGNGYTQVGTFLSGADTYYKCEVNACPMGSNTSTNCPNGYLAVHTGEYSGNQGCFRCVANECSGYQSSCENGYHATTDTCLSGSKTMVKCEVNDCSTYQTSCGEGYNATQSCLSGTTPYYTCTPKKVPAGYTSTPCGNGYTQIDTFLSGTQTYYKCEVNACTGYVTGCGNGYHTTSDTCQSGATTMYKCEANACTGYVDGCSSGYHATTDTCLSGTKTKVKCEVNDCSAYQTSCGEGYNATQSCQSGTTPYYTCTPKDVPAGYTTTPCGEGYITKDTIVSGTTPYYLCEVNKCTGYVTSCNNGYHTTSDTCKSGTTTMYKCEANACTGYVDGCSSGYHATTDTCLSGTKTMVKCEINDCSAYQTSCGEGYNAIESCISGTTSYYTCTPKEVPAGYTTTPCGEGYITKDTIISGTTPYYLCEVNKCTGYVTSCNNGYHTTSDTCKSGTTTMYKCEADSCAGYNYTVCPTGYAQSDSCLSGLTMKYKCGNCANGYGRDETGNCVTKEADEVIATGTANNVNRTYTGTLAIKGYKDLYVFKGNYVYATNAEMSETYNYPTRIINVIKKGDGNFYGVFNSEGSSYNSRNADGTIKLEKTGDGNVYALWGKDGVCNSSESGSSAPTGETAKGNIEILNNGNGSTYGGYSKEGSTINATSGKTGGGSVTSTGTIKILNNGDGNVYGLLSDTKTGTNANSVNTVGKNYSTTSSAEGRIIINNAGDGDVYGIKGGSDVYNTSSLIRGGASGSDIRYGSTNVDGYIRIKNSGEGNSYGLYGTNTYSSSFESDAEYATVVASQTSNSLIDILNLGKGNAYGMYAVGTSSAVAKAENRTYSGSFSLYPDQTYSATSNIKILNNDDGFVVGIYSKGKVTNDGNITIHNLGEGTAIGIYADPAIPNSTVTNSGNINITRVNYIDDNATQDDTSDDENYTSTSMVGGTSIGIYGASGSTIKNTGTITISGASIAYGIYAESGATVKNTGTITIDGVSCTSTNCTSANNAIVLNGGNLFQDGILSVSSAISPQSVEPMSVSSVQPASLNLNDFGGTVVASDTSQFIVEGSISGDLAINNNVIENGFDTTYSVQDMIQAGDTSSLNLQSQSALFDATLQNNTDAVMTMKAFNDVIENSSVADFLQNNYAANNNEDLFKVLKSAETVAQLNHDIDDLFGKDMLSRMAFEDLSMLREVSLDMNNHLFEKEGAFAFGESISPSSYDNNIGSVGRYSLNGYNNGKTSFGLGISITDVRTDDGHSDNRRFDRSFMMSAPIGYKTHGFELITAPKVGYADGTYDRDGFNNMTYEGKIQKRMFALMNQARYPLKFGGMKLVPSAEFNMIGYNIKGHEDDKQYALRIKSQNHYSVEAGFGLMAEKEFKPFKNHKFNVNGGVAVYHEFANPYELEVGMSGMDGYYKLQDEKRSDNRAVVRFGFGYELKDNVDVSASWLTNIDREYRTDANVDLKYHF